MLLIKQQPEEAMEHRDYEMLEESFMYCKKGYEVKVLSGGNCGIAQAEVD